MTYSDLSPPELFSVCARTGDTACWQEFMRRFNPLIARSVLRVAMRYGTSDKSLIDDLVQETYLKICANECKLLRTFTPQSPESAFGFLKVVATSVAQDFFKSRLAEKRAPESSADSIEHTSSRCPRRRVAALPYGVLVVLPIRVHCTCDRVPSGPRPDHQGRGKHVVPANQGNSREFI